MTTLCLICLGATAFIGLLIYFAVWYGFEATKLS